MRLRPVDANGDILPILHVNDQAMDACAVALFIEDRLNLFAGEWWENEDWGNEILKMMQESRLTENDAQALSVYLSDYVRNTKGVQDIIEIKFSVIDRTFHWECAVITEYGSATVTYAI